MAGVTKDKSRTGTTDAERKAALDLEITSPPSVRPASSAAAGFGESAHVQHTDSGWMHRMRDRASEQLTTQKDRATEGIGTIAQAVRGTTQELREHHHETVAEYLTSAADQLDQLSLRLKNKDVSELLQGAQDLARRQPVMFIGSAFVLGLCGARFFKSSPPRHRHDQGWRSQGGGPGSYRQTSANESRATAAPGRPNQSRPVVSNPDVPESVNMPRTESRYGDR